MLKAYKFRLKPTAIQEELINKHIGCCRLVYNLALETKIQAYDGNKIVLSRFDLMRQLPELKAEYEWLMCINSQSLQQSIINMDTAFARFFKKEGRFPKFKKKNTKQSFKIPQNILLEEGRIIFNKFKEGIAIIQHREIDGIIKQATISKTSTGKYFASILAENNKEAPKKPVINNNTTIGIDLGIKSLLATSTGIVLANPKFLNKSISKLKYIQRKYSSKKGKKRRHKLAILHEKITNQRKDFLHKSSIRLIRDNQSLAIEDLNIPGMLKNHKLARSIIDVGWGEFIRQLEYKAGWYGKNVLKIGRFDPSSKTCSICGNINKELSLQFREWTCVECGTFLDRDINAAINIKNFALKKYLSVEHGLENLNELPTLAGAMTSGAI